jgi:signal transduction histidine kinase
MHDEQPAAPQRSGVPMWACIVAALALVAVLGSAIAVFDIRRDVNVRRNEELSRLQSHAERSAAHIASQLLDDGTPTDLKSVKTARWLRTYWTQSLSRQPYRLYAAVVDLDGTIIAHTNRDQEGRQLDPQDGLGYVVPTGTTFVELSDDVLTDGQRALDVRVPIRQGNEVIGVYHAGLDADWLDEVLDSERTRRARFWTTLVSGMCCLLLLSSIAVVRVTRHTARLEHEIEAANARRVSEMHELVLGIAHEIRNPLNAIRLNLHTVGQVFRDEAALGDEEIATMLDEMEDEVVRLEALMREMLGFVRRGGQAAAAIDVAEEVHRTLTFLRANLDQRRIEVRLDFTDDPSLVAVDPTRLRQVLFNLINNAIEALTDGGMIEVAVRAARGQVEIVVADDGPGIAAEDRERVFVPFFSTKASGTGLGLALARKFIEEAGGTIRCEESPWRRGSCFRIVLPATSGAVVEAV